MSQQLDASAFVQTLGVCAHVSWPNYYPYSNTANVISALNYLGVHNIRDTINSSVTGVLDQLAKAGNHFDFIIDRQDTPSHFLSLIDSFEASHPGATRSLEGPNEVDFWPPSYAGLTGYAAARQMQIDLWNDHLADPLLKNIPVYATTISGTDASKYTQLGNISAYANYGNVHDYYGGGQPGPAWSAWTSAANIDMPGKPVVTTETGSSSAYLSYGVDETVQAKQILNTVADAALHGVSSTYLYELVESQQGDATNAEAHYGLYRYDWTPKPAAVALHNFTTILTTGPGDGSTAAVNYTISGLPSTGASVEFHEASGAHDIVVWAEPDIWNDATHQEIAAPTSQVTVNLGATYHSVVVYDPMQSAQAVQTYTDVSQVTVGVTDHPLIIEVNGSGATTGGATGGTSTPPPPQSSGVVVAGSAPMVYTGTAGGDTIAGADGQQNAIYGGDGNDSIVGGSAFNQVNGNKGDDIIVGHSTVGDWLLGGQGNDQIDASASSGHNILNGNLGNDTVIGGAGANTLRGGQGDDVIHSNGNDWISGDLGNNTIYAGQGQDTIHAGAGHDYVSGWLAGDHVLVDSGVTYTASQVNSDVHIVFSSGGEMDLLSTQLSSLKSGWILSS